MPVPLCTAKSDVFALHTQAIDRVTDCSGAPSGVNDCRRHPDQSELDRASGSWVYGQKLLVAAGIRAAAAAATATTATAAAAEAEAAEAAIPAAAPDDDEQDDDPAAVSTAKAAIVVTHKRNPPLIGFSTEYVIHTELVTTTFHERIAPVFPARDELVLRNKP